ncbi:MAG: OmpA family protein [Alphaproteobacteria bacterium]|nr:OmpA family protein [Alphaproteobacteria bacterium]
MTAWDLRTMRTGTVVVLAGLGLSACSSVPDYANPLVWYEDSTSYLFGDDEDDATAAGRAADENASFPNLSDVPDRPEGSSPETRRELREGLVADRSNARYTDQVQADPALTGQTDETASRSLAQPPSQVAATPQPAPQPAPQPTSESTTQAQRLTSVEPRPAPRAEASGSRTLVDRRTRGESFLEKLGTGDPGTTARTGSLRATAPERRSIAELAPQSPAPESAPEPASTVASAAQTSAAQTSAPQTSGTLAAVPRRAPAAPARPFGSDAETLSSGVVVIGGGGDVVALDVTGPVLAETGMGVSLHAATVYFGHSSANLSNEDRRVIEGVRRLQAETGGVLRVVGHASSRTRNLAPDRQQVANLRVSQKRADAVANALIRAGVPANRVLVSSQGDNQPVFYESMPVGEAGNRRAEIYLDY